MYVTPRRCADLVALTLADEDFTSSDNWFCNNNKKTQKHPKNTWVADSGHLKNYTLTPWIGAFIKYRLNVFLRCFCCWLSQVSEARTRLQGWPLWRLQGGKCWKTTWWSAKSTASSAPSAKRLSTEKGTRWTTLRMSTFRKLLNIPASSVTKSSPLKTSSTSMFTKNTDTSTKPLKINLSFKTHNSFQEGSRVKCCLNT